MQKFARIAEISMKVTAGSGGYFVYPAGRTAQLLAKQLFNSSKTEHAVTQQESCSRTIQQWR